jgi:DHA2 family multidrug resistance protein
MSASAQTMDQEWAPSFNPWLIAASVMLATFMEVLDTSVANVALPHIAGNLSASTDEATWVLTSYLVSNAIVLPITGWLGSRVGRKRLLITCIIIFTISSALCGAAGSLGFLIIARIIQGAGGGALQPIAQAILLESFPPENRGSAMAIYGMGIIVAPIIGPTLGGWITDNYSWRWIFYINVPVGALAVFMSQTFIEDPPYIRRTVKAGMDYIGFGLMALGLSTLQIILDKGQEEDWFASTFIVSLAVVCLISLAIFVIWELKTDKPIVDLRVLGNRNFGLGVVLILIVGAVLYGTTAMLPIFLQTLLGYPATQSGLAVSPRGLGSMLSMIIVGRMIGKIDSRMLMSVGFAILGFSCYLLGGINLQIGISNVVWPNIINGFAMGFIFVPLTTTSMGTLSNREMGNATGIYNLMRNIGGGLGISFATTFLSRLGQFHQANLVGQVSDLNPAFQQTFHGLQGAFSGSGSVGATQQAYATIYGMVQRQASLMAFIDIFRWEAIICLCCIPLVFVLKRVRASKAAAPVH